MSPRAAFHRQPIVVPQATRVLTDTIAKEKSHEPQTQLSHWQELKKDKGLIAAALLTAFSFFRRSPRSVNLAPAPIKEEVTPDLTWAEQMEKARINALQYPSRKKRLKAHAMAWGINPNLTREKRKKRWAPIHRARMTIQQMNTKRQINKILGQKTITERDAELLESLEAQRDQELGR